MTEKVPRDIDVETKTVGEFVKELSEDKFLIPTFQREFEWDRNDLKMLWDSIFRFYPIGSILYWVTDKHLHLHSYTFAVFDFEG